MAGNWDKKSGNFASRPPPARHDPAPSRPSSFSPKTDAVRNMVDRVSDALRSANEKTGFVRTDAKR